MHPIPREPHRQTIHDGGFQNVSVGWQPIETAPKDGTKILANFTHPEVEYWPVVAYWTDAVDMQRWAGFPRDAQPTHWMPLPQPPNDQ